MLMVDVESPSMYVEKDKVNGNLRPFSMDGR